MPRQIPRIPAPVVDQIGPPIINTPQFEPPVVDGLRPPIVDIPTFEPPTFEEPTYIQEPGMSIPTPSGQGGEEQQSEEEEPRELPDSESELPGTSDLPSTDVPAPPGGRPIIEVPVVGQVPLPTQSEVALAGTTAIGATAAALIGKSLVEWMVKRLRPIVKLIILKTKEKLGERLTPLEEQQYFELEGKVAKQLAADQKAERKRQVEARQQQQHRRK